MADKKISQLTAATTPLAGTEVLPIVQGGSTVKVSVANVTAGRAVSAQSFSADNTGLATPVGNFQSGDQAGARVAIVNSGAGGQSYHLVTGNPGIGNSGFALYDVTNNATRLYVGSSTGNLTLNTGNLVMGTAGKGIDFSANGGDVLNQYDEGSWTPTITASSGTITSYTSSARYTRVGRMVTANINFKITNAGTASGAIIASLSLAADGAVTYMGSGRDDNTGNMVQGRIQTGFPSQVWFATFNNASIAATNTEVFFTVQYFV